MDHLKQRIQIGIKTAQTGILINAMLAIVKVLTGFIGNSYALIADGIESAADVFSSLVVWRGLRIAGRDPNERYHFGYGKAETLSASVVALMLLAAAAAVLIAAIREILVPHHLPSPFTLPVLIVVIVLKEALFRYVSRVGDKVESSALKSDAWHHRSDMLTSLAALVGISAALLGGPGWEPADDYAALACAFVIGWTGVTLLRQSLRDLMDIAPEEAFIEQIRKIASSVEGVRCVEKVLARKSGLVYFLDMHVHADPEMSLHDAHIVSGMVKTAIRRAVPSVHGVMVHMEPDEIGL